MEQNDIDNENVNYYLAKIALKRNEIDSYHDELDKEMMNNFVKPFCDKYNISFRSGNGTYIFMTPGGTILYNRDFTTTFWTALDETIKMIDLFNEETNMMGEDYNDNN